MRLLNTDNGLMRDFLDDDIPKYVILSHTWESDQEVSFRQWEDRKTADIRDKSGFAKIKSFCAQAARDGFEWVWVDTFVFSPCLHPSVWLIVLQMLYRQNQQC